MMSSLIMLKNEFYSAGTVLHHFTQLSGRGYKCLLGHWWQSGILELEVKVLKY